MADDYGDGAISLEFYKGEISDHQRGIAVRTRNLVERRIGRYTSLKALVGSENATPLQIRRAGNLVTRALDLQWVLGNSDIAETSFFKINSQGTPLDDIEEMLLKNRRKAIAIAARAVLRAGFGHKYWSKFSDEIQKQIEGAASGLHDLLFDPEADTPVRTLDLPLGGTVSPIDALALLIDFLSIADASRQTRDINKDIDDNDGTDTVTTLLRATSIAMRMTGNGAASLGLHPAVYFYNERGVHSRHLFLGITLLITTKLSNNDDTFFVKFTKCRENIEQYLIANKSLLTQLFANVNRAARVTRVRDMLDALVKKLSDGKEFTNEDLLTSVGVVGRVLDVRTLTSSSNISDQTKSAVFLRATLSQAPKCPVCNGLLFPRKSVSYDHQVRVREGGTGDMDNTQMTHPYCNTGIRN